MTAYLGLGLVVGIGTAIVAILVVVANASPAVGMVLLGFLVAMYVYGSVWTVRVRPGLYLEHLRGESEDEAKAARIGTGRSRRLRLIAMVWMQFATIAAVGYLFFWLVFYRE